MKKLPRGFVSDKANDLFSKLELKAFRKSMIAQNRFWIGPGKKGSIKDRATSSVNIVTYKDGNFGLGIIKNGVDHAIPCGYLYDDKLCWSCNAADGEDTIYSTISVLKNYNGKIIRLINPKIQIKSLLFGLHEKILYVGTCNDSISNEKALEIIKDMVVQTEQGSAVLSMNDDPSNHLMPIQEDNDILRVYGKTAMNVLAYITDDSYVKSVAFDKMRLWITTGEDDKYFHMFPKFDFDNPITGVLPRDSHWCLFLNMNGMLIAEVCYHGFLKKAFRLGDIPDGRFIAPDGFICDWRNKKEYKLVDWLKVMPS
ncbi:MAG: hypothetical protein FWC72_01670 [Oscillospiraceae bacterium]|nr:hypothetical protein [Oscillospiraceae bacterium]